MKSRAFSILIGVVVAGTASLDLFARPDPVIPWGPKTCTKTLPDQTVISVSCTVSWESCVSVCLDWPMCRDEDKITCPGPYRTRKCMEVCDSEGNVIDLMCVCDCAAGTQHPKHENCQDIVNP